MLFNGSIFNIPSFIAMDFMASARFYGKFELTSGPGGSALCPMTMTMTSTSTSTKFNPQSAIRNRQSNTRGRGSA